MSGLYQVKLVASNSYGNDTIIRTKYVNVSPMIGISGNETTLNDYRLYQNFPNPFNPSTTIKYSIAKSGFVSLKVYDIMGREVAVLVNSVLKGGTYEAIFNADKLSSGVYYYKLFSEDFRETRKMLLIK